MQEAEGRLRARPAAPLQYARAASSSVEGADDVGLDESRRPVDRAVDVALGGEVHDRARLVLGEEARRPARGRRCRRARRRGARRRASDARLREVARVGELVEVDDRLALGRQPVEHEVRADEAGAAGHEDRHSRRLLQLDELQVLVERVVAADHDVREARAAVEEAQAQHVELHEARQRAREQAPVARAHALLEERLARAAWCSGSAWPCRSRRPRPNRAAGRPRGARPPRW